MIEVNEKDAQKAASTQLRQMKYLNWAIRAGLGLLIGAALFFLLPYAVSIAANFFQLALYVSGTAILVTAGFAAVFTFGLMKPLLKRRLERWVNNLYDNFIKEDPIAYINEEIIGFRQALQKVVDAIKKLMGIMDELKIMAEESIDEAQRNIELADHEGNESKAGLYAYYASSSIDTKEAIIQNYKEVDESVVILDDMKNMLETNIEMMEYDVKQMKTNMRIQETKSSAADSLNSILQGTPDARAKRQLAMNAYKQKVSAYSANFKQTMVRFKPLLEAKHIEDAITTTKGQELLQEFRSGGKKLSGLSDFKTQLEELKKKTGFYGDGDNDAAFKRINTASADSFRKKARFGGL